VTQDQQETLKLLYPWYKEEVFQRRESMIRLAGGAAGLLLVLLVLLLIVPPSANLDERMKTFAGTGTALFSGLMAYLILQQRARHRMAKQVLIEIERELGLYEKGRFLPDKALYPELWQTAWMSDPSVTIYLSVLVGLTGLVFAALLLR
jgi:hypothetical protein